jgi:hypothetical protein
VERINPFASKVSQIVAEIKPQPVISLDIRSLLKPSIQTLSRRNSEEETAAFLWRGGGAAMRCGSEVQLTYSVST